MSQASDVLSTIEGFSRRYKTGVISYSQLVAYIDRFILENPQQEHTFEDLLRMGNRQLYVHLATLEQAGDIKITRKDGIPHNIFFPAYIMRTLEAVFSRIDESPELAFPTEDSLGVSIPPEELKVIDIKTDFMAWLQRENTTPVFLRIGFPDGIQSLFTTSTLLSTRMVLAAVFKIRHYLRDAKNFAYVRQRLTPLFRTREIAVKDMLQSIVTSPEQSVANILEPTDFTFQLWTQLSTNIVKEYSQKSDKLAEEHGFCQAAYLIGYYNMHFRTRMQRRKDEDLALGILLQHMRRPPYAFHVSQLYEFTDDKGILLVKRCDKSRINEFIQERVTPAEGKDFPEILSFHSGESEEYFILYTSVPAYLSENLLRAQKEMRDFYKRSWMLALRGDVEFTTMFQEDAFRKHVEQRLEHRYPQLNAILTFPIVFFASRIDGIPGQIRNDLNEILIASSQRLKPVEQIMRLNRKKMFEDSKILLPAWMVIPGLKQVVRFMRNVFLGPELASQTYASGFDHEGQERLTRKSKTNENKETKPSASAPTSQQKAAAFKQAAKMLESEFLESGERLVPTLDSLAERWNQILEPKAKANLRTDIDSLCRDYLRKQRVFQKSSPPDVETLTIFAEKLITSDLLLGVRNKKDLKRYIQLYFVSQLQNG